MNFINEINDILWTYILIIMLLGCAVWFSIRTRFVQFRMLREMIILLSESAGKGKQGEKHVSSFQAFAITIASRVGTGNLAGVATAIAIGGPGAVFWMWVIATIGAASGFVESTLAQIYKAPRKGGGFVGGPAYYIGNVIYCLDLLFGFHNIFIGHTFYHNHGKSTFSKILHKYVLSLHGFNIFRQIRQNIIVNSCCYKTDCRRY